MKLYDVPKNTRILTNGGIWLNFSHIDGMYSYCEDDLGNVVHLCAWEDVSIADDKNKNMTAEKTQ